MRFKGTVVILAVLLFITTACTQERQAAVSKREVNSYSEKLFELEELCDIQMECGRAKVEIYTWKKAQVKFEMTRILRGQGEKEELEEQLKSFIVDVRQENGTLRLQSVDKSLFKGRREKEVKLKLFVPKKVDRLYCKLDSGSIRIMDDVRCNLSVDAGTVNAEINHLDGSIQMKYNTGNVRVAGGTLQGENFISGKSGNINLKTELDPKGSYRFETGMGNIDMNLTGEASICLESTGSVDRNDFLPDPEGIKVYTKSNMGTISIQKYKEERS